MTPSIVQDNTFMHMLDLSPLRRLLGFWSWKCNASRLEVSAFFIDLCVLGFNFLPHRYDLFPIFLIGDLSISETSRMWRWKINQSLNFLINWPNLGFKSYISIKTQEKWIRNAQGMTFLIELKKLAFPIDVLMCLTYSFHDAWRSKDIWRSHVYNNLK